MPEEAAAANATGIISTSFSSTSLREVGELFTQLFVLLFAIINTSMAKSPLVLALVFMVALYYWVYVLVKILQLQIRSLLIIGSVVFILALMNISPTIAWIDFGLLILIFSLMGYKNRKELYQMIPQRIKNSIEGNNDMSNSTAELGTTTSLTEEGKLLGKFSGLSLAAMNTSNGKSQVDIDLPIMMTLVFMVALFFMVLVLITMLQIHIKSFLPFMMVIVLLGSVVSVLALMMISPTIAWIFLCLWILLFALMCYENRKELYQILIPERIKKVFEG
ncbi:hypothetical protein MtrunA17_Chr7g0221101 [Medicago truncatula]|uniref:Transmembrane protein n=1 Tax=Medicago truncatula TaxID=3880 RepID=A0A396GYQ5_MEDTR|nr:hypothetical protein MtrunA17_Chr7g0221101 [Medicago truncatula]